MNDMFRSGLLALGLVLFTGAVARAQHHPAVHHHLVVQQQMVHQHLFHQYLMQQHLFQQQLLFQQMAMARQQQLLLAYNQQLMVAQQQKSPGHKQANLSNGRRATSRRLLQQSPQTMAQPITPGQAGRSVSGAQQAVGGSSDDQAEDQSDDDSSAPAASGGTGTGGTPTPLAVPRAGSRRTCSIVWR